jgi:hypothetical protein
MKDESLIEEMRAALRSDQGQAGARRRAAQLGFTPGSEDVTPAASDVEPSTLSTRLRRLLRRGTSAT